MGWGRSLRGNVLVLCIHNLPFKKCNLIGLCFLGYTYGVHFAPLGLKLDIPLSAIYTFGHEIVIRWGRVEV